MRNVNATDIQIGDVIRHYGEQLKVEDIEFYNGDLYELSCKGAGYYCTVTLDKNENVIVL